MNDKVFLSLLKQVDEPFSGWDFSFITVDVKQHRFIILARAI